MEPKQFFLKIAVLKIAKRKLIIWATFVWKFVAEQFQKSPNLVTLEVCDLLSATVRERERERERVFGVIGSWTGDEPIKEQKM